MTRMSEQIPIMEPDLSGNEKAYVLDALESGWVSSKGAYIDRLENMLAEYNDSKYALVVSNGTVALHLAMVSLGIGPGDEVIVPNLTFASSVNTVIHTGATPVLAEVDYDSYNIDCQKIERYITPQTKAVMPVHLYGNPCDMEAIQGIADKHNLLIIEDSAEALGSSYKLSRTGSIGNVGTFSFYGNKTITTGEGGAILFRDEDTFNHAKILRDHGMNPNRRYWHDHIGYNYRMTNLQAALGCAQMERLDSILDRKKTIVESYRNGLKDIESIHFQRIHENSISSNWLITPLFTGIVKDKLVSHLSLNGIETRPAFYPISSMPVYSRYIRGDYPICESISKYGLSLPSYPGLRDDEVEYIIEKIKAFYE